MSAEIPFSEAERVFEHVLDQMEQAIEVQYPGSSALQYHFHWMGEVREHRRIGATFRDAQERSYDADFYLPGSIEFTQHTRAWLLTASLQLTSQEYEVFLDLVHLGGCTGCWKVDGLIAKNAPSEVYGRSIIGVPMRQYAYITPLAILAAFAGGTLEEAWPDRRDHIATAWYLWQARHAEAARMGDTEARQDLFPADTDEPSYL